MKYFPRVAPAVIVVLVAVGAFATACGGKDKGITTVTPPDTLLTSTTVSFSGGTASGTLTAKIAATEAKRDTGLMHVTSLAANSGMLFVYGVAHDSLELSFWMKDTPIDLSVAFVSSAMTVINVDEMIADDSVTRHKSKAPFRYVIEANKGWMTAHGVAAGTVVSFTLPAGTIVDP